MTESGTGHIDATQFATHHKSTSRLRIPQELDIIMHSSHLGDVPYVPKQSRLDGISKIANEWTHQVKKKKRTRVTAWCGPKCTILSFFKPDARSVLYHYVEGRGQCQLRGGRRKCCIATSSEGGYYPLDRQVIRRRCLQLLLKVHHS